MKMFSPVKWNSLLTIIFLGVLLMLTYDFTISTHMGTQIETTIENDSGCFNDFTEEIRDNAPEFIIPRNYLIDFEIYLKPKAPRLRWNLERISKVWQPPRI